MKKPSPLILHALLSILAAWFWPLAGHAEKVESLRYEPIIGKGATATAPAAFLGAGSLAASIDLSGIPIDGPSVASGMRKTGIVYPLPAPVAAPRLAWVPVTGGHATRIRVVSSQARRLRFHVAKLNPTPAIEFRVQGTLDPSPFGPIGQASIHDAGLWLPISNGDGADLEIFVDDTVSPDALEFEIDAVNLIAADPVVVGGAEGIAPKIAGKSAHQEYDLACWNGNVNMAGLTQAADATAKVNFVSGGNSFQCTGTLLNDKSNSQTPWFATANHCIHDQPTANTASFEWFYRVTSCGGFTVDPRYTQTFGGAQLLWTDFNLEASFLKLNSPPPAGAMFIGWDTNIKVGDLVWGVHHPEGDYVKVSQGKVTALLQTVIDSVQGGSHLLDDVSFSYGGTEAGSSGSGLFSVSIGTAYWKGTLFGGPVNNYQLSSYSHLDSYYDKIRPWLDPKPDPRTECLLNWAEKQYPLLFYPPGAGTQFSAPYFYRYYWFTNAYVGVSIGNDHVYYLGPDRVMQDEGERIYWLNFSKCQ